jgi:hypothetical protein
LPLRERASPSRANAGTRDVACLRFAETEVGHGRARIDRRRVHEPADNNSVPTAITLGMNQ